MNGYYYLIILATLLMTGLTNSQVNRMADWLVGSSGRIRSMVVRVLLKASLTTICIICSYVIIRSVTGL